MIQNIGMTQVLLIVLVLVLLFGAKRIPEIARSLGKSLTEFKKGRSEGQEEETKSGNDD